MKSIVASFIIFIVMLISIFISTNYLNSICKKLETLDMQIERNVETDSWNKAYSNSLKFLNQWEEYSQKVSIFVHHAEIDNINNELWKLTQYTKCKNKDESLASTHVLKFYLDHIADMEKVNPQNIF
jgi:hypothetical protein